MISQLTIFLENQKGRLAEACRAISDAGINMHALLVADTTDFGVARIVCDTPAKAAQVLTKEGFRATVTKVIAVHVPNETGGLADLLEVCDANDLNIEYGYCFLSGKDNAIDVLKIHNDSAEMTLEEAGYILVKPDEIYEID